MAKRFSDSNKWSKPFIRKLKAPYKLLWLYLLDECDHAGVWQVDFDTAQIRIGEKLNPKEALKCFEGKIVEIDGGEKWFIFDFVEFQYGVLKLENRVHESVINILKKYELIDENLKIKPLTSPLQGAKDKDKDKDLDKDKEKAKEKDPEKIEIVLPFQTEIFSQKWQLWKSYRSEIKKPYKTIQSEQMALKELSEFDEEFSIGLIERSISNQWQGLVFTKTKQEFKDRNSNGTQKTGRGEKPTNSDIEAEIKRFYGNNQSQ